MASDDEDRGSFSGDQAEEVKNDETDASSGLLDR
jgi:hypothetical protein